MIRVNENYKKLTTSYLFPEIAKRVNAFQAENPAAKVIRMGIGDVTEPLPNACVKAFEAAVREMSDRATFKGYGPEQGYAFLREKIATQDYATRGVNVAADEIFISDGSKCDVANIQELFATDIKVGIPDPVYPVYLDTNVMAGRTGAAVNGRYEGIEYLPCTAENKYIPALPKAGVDLVYLCSPNNPTGAVMTREQLTGWVQYAKANKSVILYDSAYFAFISDAKLPQSIYEIPGAREVAIEFRSFSKTAGFTGVRCAFTVIPKECKAYMTSGEAVSLRDLWNRRHSTKFNGTAYPVQRAAEAVYSPEGQEQVRGLIQHYMGNASIIRNLFVSKGLEVTGGIHAPYVWVKTNQDSWKFFDKMLTEAHIVCTPGVGFGQCGEGHARFSAFNSRANVEEAVKRIEKAM